MSDKEVQEMIGEANILKTNLKKEYEAYKKEADTDKINAFYTKITKLVDYVPFVRQMQQKFGVDPKVDAIFVEVQADLKKIVEETKMAERGVIDAFDVAPLVATQVRSIK